MTPAIKPFLSLTVALLLAAAAGLPAGALAQGLNNPLNRNPQDRSSVPDTATVTQDVRNSSTRPTQPAAPSQPDERNADLAPRDTSRYTSAAPVAPPPPVIPASPAVPAASAAPTPALPASARPPGS